MSESGPWQPVIDNAERAAAAGDYASAERHLREAVVLQEAALGPLHPDLANTLNNLGVVCEITNHAEDSEWCYRRAYKIAVSSLPGDHPFVATSLKNLTDFCSARQRPLDLPEPEARASVVDTPRRPPAGLGELQFPPEPAPSAPAADVTPKEPTPPPPAAAPPAPSAPSGASAPSDRRTLSAATPTISSAPPRPPVQAPTPPPIPSIPERRRGGSFLWIAVSGCWRLRSGRSGRGRRARRRRQSASHPSRPRQRCPPRDLQLLRLHRPPRLLPRRRPRSRVAARQP